MGNTFYFDWEVSLMEWLQSVMGEAGKFIAIIFTYLGEVGTIIAILGFVYLIWDKDKGRIVGLNAVMTVVWNPLIKNVFLRRRPYFDNPGIKCLKPVEPEMDLLDVNAQGFSFPSGHAMNTTAVIGGVAYVFRKNWLTILSTILIIMVGVSRFCLGVHYPTDVMVGWIVGLIFVFMMPVLLKKIKRTWLLYLVITLVSCVGFFFCKTNDYYTGIGCMIGFFVGDLFEKKYVKFENTRNIWAILIRLVIVAGVYLGGNVLFKLPFSAEFLESDTMIQYVVRMIRYALILFLEIGIAPMCYKPLEKLFHISGGVKKNTAK
ncbi:MAG: phosphatase PAP2 family protein [Lachnospiraceae bacterium]|nr:phosphatase PAP2 family protein [Candidatus Merdinaster equi]